MKESIKIDASGMDEKLDAVLAGINAVMDGIQDVLRRLPPPEDAAPAEQPALRIAPPAPEPTPEQPQGYTLEDVRRKVVELTTAGHKAQVREIVKDYAETVSCLPEDKFPEIMDRLTALEG